MRIVIILSFGQVKAVIIGVGPIEASFELGRVELLTIYAAVGHAAVDLTFIIEVEFSVGLVIVSANVMHEMVLPDPMLLVVLKVQPVLVREPALEYLMLGKEVIGVISIPIGNDMIEIFRRA